MSPTSADARAERRLEVLRAVVRSFVVSGEPVGSKAIAGQSGCEVSAATVRHLMGELEELGYLSQPHASAGRVPTESGYRLYVDRVLDERRRQGVEPPPTIPRELLEHQDLPAVMVATSRLLSRLCRCVGLVLHPRLAQTRVRHAQFLRLDRARIVALVVGDEGVISDKVVAVGEDYAQDELDRFARFVVNRFKGSTLLEIKRALEAELQAERAAYDAALGRWTSLALTCLESWTETDQVSLDGGGLDGAGAPGGTAAGAGVVLADPVLAEGAELDNAQLRELLRAYEEKDRIARLLGSCLEREGVQIRIGREDGGGSGLNRLALVASQYGEAGRPLGSVGVLGPTRMEYERVIEIVDGVARDLSQAFVGRFSAANG